MLRLGVRSKSSGMNSMRRIWAYAGSCLLISGRESVSLFSSAPASRPSSSP